MLARVNRGLQTLFAVCFVAAMGGILLQNGACIAVLVLLLCVFLCMRFRLPRFTLWLFFGALLLRVVAAISIQTPIVSDFYTVFHAAQSFNAGDFSYLRYNYFLIWAYQNAHVLWNALWLRLWNDPLCLELLNCLLSAGSVCLVYRIARGLMSRRAACMAGMMAAIFPFSLLLPNVLTNQIPSAFFLLLGVWLLIGRDCDRLRFWRYPLAGLALQVGNILRPEGVIVLVGVLAWLVFAIVEKPARAKRLLCGLLVLLVVYFSTYAVADFALRRTGVSPNGLSNGNPLWKFVVGLNTESGGAYSEQDRIALLGTLKNTDAAISPEIEAQERRVIRERLLVPLSEWNERLQKKIENLWDSDRLYWIVGLLEGHPEFKAFESPLVPLAKQADRAWLYLAVIAALGGLLGVRRRADQLLCCLILFTAFCAFLVVECQSRYIYLPQFFLFIAAGLGFDRLFAWLGRRAEPKESVPEETAMEQG